VCDGGGTLRSRPPWTSALTQPRSANLQPRLIYNHGASPERRPWRPGCWRPPPMHYTHSRIPASQPVARCAACANDQQRSEEHRCRLPPQTPAASVPALTNMRSVRVGLTGSARAACGLGVRTHRHRLRDGACIALGRALAVRCTYEHLKHPCNIPPPPTTTSAAAAPPPPPPCVSLRVLGGGDGAVLLL
jgi:hypothetical protein